jgi:ketosteroid isomerase-like protein
MKVKDGKLARKQLVGHGWWALCFTVSGVLFAAAAAAGHDTASTELRAVQTVVEDFARAWSARDRTALARLVAEAAVLTTPWEDESSGWQVNRPGRLRRLRLTAESAAIDFPTDNIAVVEGTYRIASIQRPGGKTIIAGPLLLRLERHGSQWKIAGARLYDPAAKLLALRDAHNQRYPFLELADALVSVHPESARDRVSEANETSGELATVIR